MSNLASFQYHPHCISLRVHHLAKQPEAFCGNGKWEMGPEPASHFPSFPISHFPISVWEMGNDCFSFPIPFPISQSQNAIATQLQRTPTPIPSRLVESGNQGERGGGGGSIQHTSCGGSPPSGAFAPLSAAPPPAPSPHQSDGEHIPKACLPRRPPLSERPRPRASTPPTTSRSMRATASP